MIYAAYLAVCAAFTFEHLQSLASVWSTSPYSYGPFAIAIAIILAWRQREHAISEAPRWSRRATIIVFAFALLSGASQAMDMDFGGHLSVPGLIASGAWMISGDRAARRWALPLGFLFFMVPMGASLLPVLQIIAAQAATLLVALAGLSPTLQDLTITTDAGRFYVAPSCAGLRYVMVAAMTAVLVGAHIYKTARPRFLFFICAIAAALFANALRVATIVALASYHDGFRARLDDHAFIGWIIFAVFIFALVRSAQTANDRAAAR